MSRRGSPCRRRGAAWIALPLMVPAAAMAQLPSRPAPAGQPISYAAPLLSADMIEPDRQKAMNDDMYVTRKLAADVLAAALPAPRHIVQVGAFQGEFLEVFLDRFPSSPGSWIEAVTSRHNLAPTQKRLARLGNRIDFRWGCARRDLGPGCTLPPGTDVVLIEWLSIQQTLDGIYRIYRQGADKLPQGGWIINVDHVSYGGRWEQPIRKSVLEFRRPQVEGPPVHYPQFRVPTVDEQLAAMRAAGLDAQVVWQSFNTVLLMGRKP